MKLWEWSKEQSMGLIEKIIGEITTNPLQAIFYTVITVLLLMINRKTNLNYMEQKSDRHATIEMLKDEKKKDEYRRIYHSCLTELKERYSFLKGIGVHLLVYLKLIFHFK